MVYSMPATLTCGLAWSTWLTCYMCFFCLHTITLYQMFNQNSTVSIQMFTQMWQIHNVPIILDHRSTFPCHRPVKFPRPDSFREHHKENLLEKRGIMIPCHFRDDRTIMNLNYAWWILWFGWISRFWGFLFSFKMHSPTLCPCRRWNRVNLTLGTQTLWALEGESNKLMGFFRSQ